MPYNLPPIRPIFDMRAITSLSRLLAAEATLVLPPDYASARHVKDAIYVSGFIHSYSSMETTAKSYLRELERYVQWVWVIKDKTLTDINRDDVDEYMHFCKSPPKSWVAGTTYKKFLKSSEGFTPNPEWRPFAGAQPYNPSQKTIEVSFTILLSFYSYLCEERVTDVNPFNLIRQKSKYFVSDYRHKKKPTITQFQWDYVIRTADQRAHTDDTYAAWRTFLIISMLYGVYLRLSDLSEYKGRYPLMSDIRKSSGVWVFDAHGKRNKIRSIPLPDQLIDVIKKYRASLGLSGMPKSTENTPLLMDVDGMKPLRTGRMLHNIVKAAFMDAHAAMVRDGVASDADELLAASAHWLRHTGITEAVKHRPTYHVRDDAGHESLATTESYVETDWHERHESGRHADILSKKQPT